MRESIPSREEARALAANHALIPVYREVLADMLTPVRAYTLLCPPDEPGFLLESVEGGERLARYSFIGAQARALDLDAGNPLDALARVAGEETAPVRGIPRFHGGAVGYLSYETARHFERLPVAKGAPPPMPESAFLRAEDLAVFDHVTRRLQLLTIHRPDREDYDAAVARIDAMEHRLAGDPPPPPPRGVDGARWEPNVTKGQFHAMADAAEDQRLEKELLSDLKERAEHVMLVDLGRNDVGRVARPGSVAVDRLMEIERYSHVMHISSTVSGQLRDGKTSLDALRAAFPAGTVSGAPKIRAMEVIAELEPEQRGVYAGSLGYVSFGGNLDMAITLRTVVVAEGNAYVQAGCGVVADSRPEREYEETLEKAGAMFKAIEMAEAM